MNNWMDIVNFALAVTGLTSAIFGLALSLTAPYIDPRDRSFFVPLFVLIVFYVAADLVSQLSLGMLGPEHALLSKAAMFLESLLSSTLMPLLSIYLMHCANVPWRKSLLFRTVMLLWTIYLLLLVTTQFTGDLYYFTPNNVYQRGAWYPLLLAPPALLMATNLVGLWRLRNRLTPRRRIAFAAYLGIPLACTIFQMFAYGLLAIVAGISTAALAMFGFILTDQMRAHVARREEAARQRSALMALQMRPHFIYNVMTSIYYLCEQDPKRAQQVTLDFTQYLRANFAAVVKEGTVPFLEELGHTRAYLAVEQARFEGKLEVEIDCPHEAFQLPPLTLQPLVENAVKHGVDPELPPLCVRITSKYKDGCSIVTVEDTGPGFDPHVVDRNPASALANIRERLLAVGMGFSIASHEGSGTVITLSVPNVSA